MVDGASHEFVYGREPGYDAAIDITVNFLKAHVLDDSAALEARNGIMSAAPIDFRRR